MARDKFPYLQIPECTCWLWLGGWDSDGYGLMTGNVKAHRYSYELHVGPIPDGMRVCHSCDTPSCVNPAHLFLGTGRDNIEDMLRKGRSLKGSRNHQSKLTEAEVSEILSSQESYTSLGARFGVSFGLIGHIKRRKAWKHVPDPDPMRARR